MHRCTKSYVWEGRLRCSRGLFRVKYTPLKGWKARAERYCHPSTNSRIKPSRQTQLESAVLTCIARYRAIRSPEIIEPLLECLLAVNVVGLGFVLVAGYCDDRPSRHVLQCLVGDGKSLREVGPFCSWQALSIFLNLSIIFICLYIIIFTWECCRWCRWRRPLRTSQVAFALPLCRDPWLSSPVDLNFNYIPKYGPIKHFIENTSGMRTEKSRYRNLMVTMCVYVYRCGIECVCAVVFIGITLWTVE